MIYRIKIDLNKCSSCGRCEEHWPGITAMFNGHGYFDLTGKEMIANNWRYEWAVHLCPGKDGVTEAISREVCREKDIQT